MGFWEHAFDSLGDNLEIVWSVAEDLSDNLNPGSDAFLSGDAPNTARTVEEQRAADEGRAVDQGRIDRSAADGLELVGDAVTATGGNVAAATGKALSGAGTVLDAATNPWVIGAVVALVVAVVAAPYVVPAMKAVTS